MTRETCQDRLVRAVYREQSPSISRSKCHRSCSPARGVRVPPGCHGGFPRPPALPSARVQSSCEGRGGQAELCLFLDRGAPVALVGRPLPVAVRSSKYFFPSLARRVWGWGARVEWGAKAPSPVAVMTDRSPYRSHRGRHSVQGWSVRSLREKGTNGSEEPAWGRGDRQPLLARPAGRW